MSAVPLTVKIALVLLVIGAVVFVIGFSTNYWADYETEFKYPRLTYDYKNRRHEVWYTGFRSEHFGLWKRCYYHEWDKKDPQMRRSASYIVGCHSLVEDEDAYDKMGIADELRAAQFFETVALLLLIPTILLLVIGMCVEACQNRRIMPILAGICLAIAAGCVFVGAIIFGTWLDGGAQSRDDLGWSFALTIVGGVFFAISAIVIIVGVIVKK